MSVRIAIDGLYACCKYGDIDAAGIVIGIRKFNKIRKEIDAEKELERFHAASGIGQAHSRHKAIERILRTYKPRDRLETPLCRYKQPVQHFAPKRTGKRCYDHVVDRGRACFHKQFPKKRTACGKQKALIKIETVCPSRIKIEGAGIGVRELIDRKGILIELPLAV